jgi:hypothetical protein
LIDHRNVQQASNSMANVEHDYHTKILEYTRNLALILATASRRN